MSDLYLIAHKVRGEPAFDIAEQVECVECGGNSDKGREPYVCFECDDLGYWWIIPTSGHRAYPYWSQDLMQAKFGLTADVLAFEGFTWEDIGDAGPMPNSLPDHYRARAEPKRTIDVSALVKAKPFKMNRRI